MLKTTSAGGSAGVQHLPEGPPGLLWFWSGGDLLGDGWLQAAGSAEDHAELEQPGPAVGHLKSGSSCGLWKAVAGQEGLLVSLESRYRRDGPGPGPGLEDTPQCGGLLARVDVVQEVWTKRFRRQAGDHEQGLVGDGSMASAPLSIRRTQPSKSGSGGDSHWNFAVMFLQTLLLI